jgi:nicotinamide-nucleotide amidase
MPGAARVELLCIGSELLGGQVNTHQSYLCLALRAAGLEVSKESSLPDETRAIAAEVRRALQNCDVLLTSGGLGPTFDDVTREAVASALGRRLLYHADLYAGIKKKFSRYKLPVPRENERQAFVIQGAEVIKNRTGSAPGQLLVLPRAGRPQTIVMMPGPFSELSPMFEKDVLPRLRRTYAAGAHTASLSLHLCGVPESSADEALKPVTSLAGAELSFTILAGPGQVDFHARARARSARRARSLIASVRRSAYRRIGAYVFGEAAETLESVLGGELRRRGLTLGLAESCTGGMAGARLTNVPGSSGYFKGGILSYGDDVKTGVLGVREKTLRRHGAVSGPCAAEMAAGARRLTRAGVGLAITGIAGPGGGTTKKPVGLVWVAVNGPGRRRGAWPLLLSGGRDIIRQRAVTAALHRLLRHLREKKQ